MDGIIRRRGMVKKDAPAPSKPYPYSIEDWDYSGNNIVSSLRDWNSFSVECTATQTYIGILVNVLNGDAIAGTNPGSSPTYFTIPSGSSITINLTNISNAYSMPIELYTTVGGSNTKVTSLQLARFTNATDKTVTATMSADQTVGGIWIYLVRTGRYAGNVFECDLEVYVDGIRWI